MPCAWWWTRTPIPVLVGNWSEEAEKKILATLDPVGQMATGDVDAYQAPIDQVLAQSLWSATSCTTRWRR